MLVTTEIAVRKSAEVRSGHGKKASTKERKNFSFKKTLLLVVNFLFNYNFVFRLLGFLRIFRTVFVAYPATEKYALAYVDPQYRDRMRWTPWIVGIFCQDGYMGLMMVISSTEKDFTVEETDNLRRLYNRTEKIRSLLRANQKTFAGVLPGIFIKTGITTKCPEADITIIALRRAEEEVRRLEGHSDKLPIILLGGKGFIGDRYCQLQNGREVCLVDKGSNGPINAQDWPEHLFGKPAILVNVSRYGVLQHYTHLFWPGLIVLNESYPEPDSEVLRAVKLQGATVYHLVGFRAWSLPKYCCGRPLNVLCLRRCRSLALPAIP